MRSATHGPVATIKQWQSDRLTLALTGCGTGSLQEMSIAKTKQEALPILFKQHTAGIAAVENANVLFGETVCHMR